MQDILKQTREEWVDGYTLGRKAGLIQALDYVKITQLAMVVHNDNQINTQMSNLVKKIIKLKNKA